jgi:hypothetical protein
MGVLRFVLTVMQNVELTHLLGFNKPVNFNMTVRHLAVTVIHVSMSGASVSDIGTVVGWIPNLLLLYL